MPDNYATMSAEEQTYFDTQGGQAPGAPKEPEKKPESAKQPAAKKAEKTAPASAEPPAGEVAVETQPVEPVKKSPEQEQIENLNAALREERAAAKERDRKTEQRLQQLQEALSARQVPDPKAVQPQEIPDPDKDPMGALKALLAVARENKQIQDVSAQEVQRRQQEQRIMGDASRMEMEFLREQPDYDPATRQSPTYNEASAFLVNMRRAELNALGTYNPIQINQLVAQEAIGLAAQAIQAGRNPAQVVLDVARARGFTPKPQQAPAVTQAVTETEAEKLARVAKGQEAGFSLSQASGSKAPSNKGLDAKTLANMTDDDFTAFLDKAKKSDLRGLMGD